MAPEFEMAHWQLVDAVMLYLESFHPDYARMSFDARRLEAKRQLDSFVMRCLNPPTGYEGYDPIPCHVCGRKPGEDRSCCPFCPMVNRETRRFDGTLD